MAIDLTTPVAVPDISYQGITKVDFHFPHYLDSGDGNAMKLTKPGITVVFTVTTWAGDGTVLNETRHQELYPDWPPTLITDVRAVYARLEQYAVASGWMEAGTPEAV